ncbi:MAG: response regulator [Candidatus Omnitrophota bacterium]|nr:response regulator [Candidatus Omnitrophota bacterium]
MNILIADDEKGFIDFVAERLKFHGHEVDAAYDGQEAMELIKTDKYDIVFLDHNMPELTGLELAKHMKENKMKAKIVMVTGYEHMSGFFAKTVGVDEYLVKPIRIKDIDDVVNKYSKG